MVDVREDYETASVPFPSVLGPLILIGVEKASSQTFSSHGQRKPFWKIPCYPLSNRGLP